MNTSQLQLVLIDQCRRLKFFSQTPKTQCLTTSGSTILWEKRPNPPQPTTNPLEFRRIDLVAGSDFAKLVIFARIDHLTHQVVTRNVAEDSGRSVEFPTQGVLCQHVRVYQDMARGDKGGQLPDGKAIILSSADGKEDVRCLAKLPPGCFCSPTLP